MINILIRTHNRPEKFRKCIKSIESQTYKDWRIIISADNDRAERWVKLSGYEYIRTDKVFYKSVKEIFRLRKHFNRYFNVLQERVKDGFIIYMDEDVIMKTENSLQLIADNAKEDKLLIYKYRIRLDRWSRPEIKYWNKKPERTHINTGSFCHHAKHKVEWRGISAGDYFAVSDLYNRLETIWLDKEILMGQPV